VASSGLQGVSDKEPLRGMELDYPEACSRCISEVSETAFERKLLGWSVPVLVGDLILSTSGS
jgi:hypothetical protein